MEGGRVNVTFRKPRPPQNDSTCASIQEDHSRFSLIGGGKIPNSSQFELVDSPVHGWRRVESSKSEVEHQIRSVLDVFRLLFCLLSADELKLSCMFEVT
jgi:hypothetical protein